MMLWIYLLTDSSTCAIPIMIEYDGVDDSYDGIDKLLSKVKKPQRLKKSQKLLVWRKSYQSTNLLLMRYIKLELLLEL